jgi:hypothetical protein
MQQEIGCVGNNKQTSNVSTATDGTDEQLSTSTDGTDEQLSTATASTAASTTKLLYEVYRLGLVANNSACPNKSVTLSIYGVTCIFMSDCIFIFETLNSHISARH